MSVLKYCSDRNKRILINNNYPYKAILDSIREELIDSIVEEGIVEKFYIEEFRDKDGFIIVYYTCLETIKENAKRNFSYLEKMYDAKFLHKSEEFFKEELLE